MSVLRKTNPNNGMIMIKAVIFDWGGVLVENPTQPMIRYIAETLGIPETAGYAGVEDSLMLQFQKGMVSEDHVWERICAAYKVPMPRSASLWKEAFAKAYRPRHELFAFAALLKQAGYRIGLLSNTESPAMEFFFEQGYDMFDETVFSCAEASAKPEPTIYERALERLDVLGKEAFFIDDRADFVAGAQKAGLHAVVYHSLDQVKKDLAARLNNLVQLREE
jgi:HAD superfamily hydrolase (TIGR01509 family)